MKTTLMLIIAVTAALLGGGVWLYAAPQQTQPAIQNPAPPAQRSPTVSKPEPAAGVSGLVASTTPTIATPVVTPSTISVGTSTQVVVTIQISDPNLIQGSVNLLRVGAANTQSIILGSMHNDGNGRFSLQPTFIEDVPEIIQLQVSASFRGLLKRVLSNTVALNVWNVVNGNGFQYLYPPGLALKPVTSTRPAALSGNILLDPLTSTNIAVTTYSNPLALSIVAWYTQILQANEYSGSFGAVPQNVILIPQNCNDSPGLLVTSEVFSNQVARLFCPAQAGQLIVEFEGSASDGDASPIDGITQLAATFSTR